MGLSQQLLKLQLPFLGNFQTQLRSDSNFIFRIVFICFLDASIFFFDIQQLFIRQEAQVLQEHQWLFFLLLSALKYIYLVKFSFQVHRSKLKNFQTHNRNHPKKLLFGNLHLLQFPQYFL